MEIKFVWTPFFISSKKSKPKHFSTWFEMFAYMPSMLNLTFDKTNQELIERIHKFDIYVYHYLSDDVNKHNDFIYQKDVNFLSAISSKIKLISERIEKKIDELNLAEVYKNVTYKISFWISGHSYVESVYNATTLKDTILINDPTKGEKFGHKIPFLEKESLHINKALRYVQISFDFSHFIIGKLSSSSKKVFIFDPYIESLCKFNCQLIEAISKINSIKTPNKIKESKLFAYYFFRKWLSSIWQNIEEFLCIHKMLICEIEKYISGSNNIQLIRALSDIFISMIFEMLNPKHFSVSNTKSIVLFFKGMKAMLPKPLLFVQNVDFLDIDEEIIGKKRKFKKFKNDFIDSWVKALHDVRNNTYHPNKVDDEFSFESNFLMSYIEHGQKVIENIKNTEKFINEAKEFIINLYFLIWKIFNYLTNNNIFAKAEDVKNNLLKKIEKN